MKSYTSDNRKQIAKNTFLLYIRMLFMMIVSLYTSRVILNVLGVDLTGIVAALAACAVAIGLALENSLSNLASGLILISSKMINCGDYISVNGVEGSVENINFLFTTLITPDNKKITMPNSDVINNALTNYGANSIRRVDFTFGVAYESDVELVKKIVTDVMHSNGSVRLDKPIFCRMKYMKDSCIEFFANCWVDSEDYWDVYYYVMENVFNEFKRNNISVPYNQIEMRERRDEVVMPVIGSSLPERVEKERKVQKHGIDLENDDIISLFKHANHGKGKIKEKNRKKKIDMKIEKDGKVDNDSKVG